MVQRTRSVNRRRCGRRQPFQRRAWSARRFRQDLNCLTANVTLAGLMWVWSRSPQRIPGNNDAERLNGSSHLKTERFRHDHHTNRPGSTVNALLPAAETIANRLIARHETIATAESSTGGLIAAALLAVPGASAYFLGGAVVYTELARAALLGISDAEMQGLRSATETYALLLARRVRDRHAAVWGVGETGATGPTGNRHGDPAGHTCIAIADRAGNHAAHRQSGAVSEYGGLRHARARTAWRDHSLRVGQIPLESKARVAVDLRI